MIWLFIKRIYKCEYLQENLCKWFYKKSFINDFGGLKGLVNGFGLNKKVSKWNEVW